MRTINESGNRYGRLYVVHPVKTDKAGAYFWCKCDCGNDVEVKGAHLRTGGVKSCGCLRVDTCREMADKGCGYGSENYYRKQNLERNYGITLDDYDDMLDAQEGRCAICGTVDPKGRGRFHVDHCHSTGIVRGLLCHHCNVGLGHFEDNVDRLYFAIEYLQAGKFGK